VTGVPKTTEASSGTPESASRSIVTDSVAGVPDSGVSLLAVLVGAAVLTGSVGVADIASVVGASDTDVAASSLEHDDKPATPSKTTAEITTG
jgi:hypothetical protein